MKQNDLLTKLLLLCLMLVGSMNAWADTETSGVPSGKDEDVVGTSFTVASTYVAGAGTKISPMSDKGIKIRTNQNSNKLPITVNDLCTITELTIYAASNDKSKTVTVEGITVDGEDYTSGLSFPITLAQKNASTATTIALTGISATDNITLSFGGTHNQGIIELHVTYEKAAATAPTITTQPAPCTVLALNGTTTLSVEATPSSGDCTYNWYACDAEGVTSGESLGTSASYTVPSSATASAATLYYCCVVGDGGANTTKSNVAKINVIDRAAKQTWDFTTISEEDIKYNETFWTRKSSGVYNHNFTKATDGTLLDNFGKDLLNGIKVRRDAGDCSVYVYTGGYGINVQGAESKPGMWKIPVESGKLYKVTYTSQTDGKTLGYTIGGDASYVSGDLTATITTRWTNTANFIAMATADGTMTLTNKGGEDKDADANCCTIVKIEVFDATTYDVTYNLNGGTGTTPTQEAQAEGAVITLHDGVTGITAPTGMEFDGWLCDIDDVKYAGGASYTMTAAATTFTAQWKVYVPKYTVTYALNGGEGDAPTQADTAAGESFTLAAAPTRAFYTFDGWLCDIDDVKYAAGAEYTMTAANTTFTAQWKDPQYATTLDFATEAATAEPTAIATFLAGGNMIGTGLTSKSAWDNNTEKTGFVGFKLKDSGATVKFMAQAGKFVTITLGSVGDNTTLKKNGATSTIAIAKFDNGETIVPTFYADEDMIVELITTSTQTVTLKEIAFADAKTITLNSKGLATYSAAFDFTFSGAQAYKMLLDEENKTIAGTEVTGKIAKGEGILFKGEAGATVTITPTTGASAIGESNSLKGTTGSDGMLVSAVPTYTYVLSGNTFVPYNDENKVFATDKAYIEASKDLKTDVGAHALTITFDDEETTGISRVENSQLTVDSYYNLAGQRVAQPQKGLYIMNGKKVIIK